MLEKVHILYMEDNEGTARLLQKRLARMGYEIDLAANGEAGLELYADRPYDAIIVDHNMPVLSGLQVIQRLADQGAMPPTIMLTGSSNVGIAVEALKLGAFDYVVKDIDGVYLDLLPPVIEQALKSRQLLQDKRRAEEALQRSEKYYRSLNQNSLDLIVLTDGNGIIRYASPSAKAVLGYDEQELLNRDGATFLSTDNREESARFFRTLVETRDSRAEMQLRIQNPDGSPRWLEVRARNLLHEPWIESVVFNIRDITERKHAEDALNESEARFRMLFAHAPDPYFITDMTGTLLDCNQEVERLFGLSRNDLVGKNLPQMQSRVPGQPEQVVDMLTLQTQVSQSGSPELTVTRSDGASVVVELRVIPTQFKGQDQILGIGHDITWRKQAEAQMQAHIEQLENLRRIDDELTRELDTRYVQTMALDNMIRLSYANAGSIGLVNEAGLQDVQSMGYPKALEEQYSLSNRSIVARVARRQKAEWVQDVSNDPDYFAVLPDTCSQITIPLISQNRLIGVVSLETNQPDYFTAEIFEFLRLIAGRIAVAIDNAQLYETSQKHVIELQTLYDQISKLEQLKTDMIRMASHDLRDPLAVVSTRIHLLRNLAWDQLTEKQHHHIDVIDNAAKQMEAITTDFLSLERIEQITKGAFRGEKFNLRDLVQRAFENYRAQAEGKSQNYRFSLSESPLPVWGLMAEVQQVIVNIIGNAIKYTQDGGTIEVILRQQNGLARFEVIDNGYGIPIEQQDKVFQPFFRAQMEETKSIGGTGLGLYLVKKIIERNGGQIIFRSERGKGSTFGFELPLPIFPHEQADS